MPALLEPADRGVPTCAKCGWRFEIPSPAAAATEDGPAGLATRTDPDRPMIVEIQPDPIDRRQVARRMAAAFEVTLLASVAGIAGAIIGAWLGATVGLGMGNGFFGSLVVALVWGAAFSLASFDSMLRFLAR